MPAKIIDGKKLASELEASLEPRISALEEKGVKPVLAVVLVGNNPASELYVKKKQEASRQLGIESRKIELPETVPEKELIEEIKKLNSDKKTHGVLVQLPLPPGINTTHVIESILSEKDVDGFTSQNMGKLALGVEELVSCTPKGIVKLIESTGKRFEGARACIVGHGLAVGLPLALMLFNRNCTLSVCDRHTKNLALETCNADILVSCAGVPSLVRGGMIKEGAVVIDVGINRVNGRLCGDVLFEEAMEKAGFITPVPGGVGPMTVACLMENTVIAAEKAAGAERIKTGGNGFED